jgi:uncharacterized membrane protein YkvA (DUF1232 family)
MTASFSSRKPPVSLWATVTSYARLLFRADTPWTVKGILALALLYLLSPLDLVPDWILGLGLLDDLAIVALLVGWAIRLAGRPPKISPEKQK